MLDYCGSALQKAGVRESNILSIRAATASSTFANTFNDQPLSLPRMLWSYRLLRGARKHPVHVKSVRWIGADVQREGKPTGGERGEGQVVEFDVAQAQGHQQKDRDGGVLGFLPGPSPSGSLPPTPILESDFHHPPAQAWWQDRPMQMQMHLPGKPDCMLDMVNVPSVGARLLEVGLFLQFYFSVFYPPSVITIPALPGSETLQFPRGFQHARACTASTSTPRLPAQRQHREHRASQSIPVRAAAAATFAIRAPPRRVGVLRDHDPHGDVHAARRCQVYPTKVQSRLCTSKSSRNSRSALGTSPMQRKPSILGLGLGTSLGKSSGGRIGIGTGLPSALTIGRSATGGKASTASSVGGPAFVPHANPNNDVPQSTNPIRLSAESATGNPRRESTNSILRLLSVLSRGSFTGSRVSSSSSMRWAEEVVDRVRGKHRERKGGESEGEEGEEVGARESPHLGGKRTQPSDVFPGLSRRSSAAESATGRQQTRPMRDRTPSSALRLFRRYIHRQTDKAPTAFLMPPLDVRNFVVDAVPKMRRCTAASSRAGDFSSPTEIFTKAPKLKYSEQPWGSLSPPIKSSRTLAQKRVAMIRCNRGIAVFHPPQRATLGLPLAARQVVADASAKNASPRYDVTTKWLLFIFYPEPLLPPLQASHVAADTGVETRDAICCHREMAA
ncbi:hypothetical protein B0H13DRAFT_1911106 [Mycena leptocephala]|nr:hypothetical protein B0H13DRAFT_1911106 [Mycena leptocephala]